MGYGRTAAVVFLTIALMSAAGCASSEEPAAPAEQEAPATSEQAAATLEGTSWDCVDFVVGSREQQVLSDAPITAEFSTDGKLTGSAGVNTYTTTYETDGAILTIAPEIATTMMAGSDEAMAQESNYLTTLATVVSYEIAEDGRLVLFGPAQNTIARYTPAQ